MSERCDSTRLEDRVLNVVIEFNKKGRAPRFSEIRDAVPELKMCKDPNKDPDKVLDRILSRLVRSGVLIKYKTDPKRRSSEAFYVAGGYEHLLDKYRFSLTEEHLLTIVEGMYSIINLRYGLFLTSDLNRAYAIPPESVGWMAEAAGKAYLALQHILSGKAFTHLRRLLDDVSFEKKTMEFLSELRREADYLRDFRHKILSEGEKVAKLYGRCEVCGPRLTEDEKKKLREWWQKLGLQGYSPIVDAELSLLSPSTAVY